MRLPFVSRKTFDAACVSEAKAIKRAKKAERALLWTFGVSVQDALESDQKEMCIWVSNLVLRQFQGNPRDLLRAELHRMLDQIVDTKVGEK